ncbi:MAG TPA: RNA polymerase sigma factor [Polyangia bacterium]|jgi:RNA polymerase sigma-70 factor (ECF subfamily)
MSAEKSTLRLVRGEGRQASEKVSPFDGPSDDALVAAVHSGDFAAAAPLCARVTPQIRRTVRRLLGADSDADDVAQVSLIEVVKTIGRYRGDCSLDRWVQTVTAHVIFKHIRRRRLERRIFTGLLADDVHAGPLDLAREAIARGLVERIAAHLDELSEQRAWAFLLHDVLGYDLSEIAEMTGDSVAAVQSRLSRGRRDLHARIARDPELAELMRVEGAGS